MHHLELGESALVTTGAPANGTRFHRVTIYNISWLCFGTGAIFSFVSPNLSHVVAGHCISFGWGSCWEFLFSHILPYLHSGDHSVLVPEAQQPSHVTCDDEIDTTKQDPLPLKEILLQVLKDLQEKPDNSISLPHCGDGNYLCKHPSTLLVHVRLYVFATRHELDRLENVSLQALY
jgi:hypothetical protein